MSLYTSAIRVLSYPGVDTITLPEIISALSFALDLTEGAVPGHAVRTCLLGMRIAIAARVPEDQCDRLYYALLLKDSGCGSNTARISHIVGAPRTLQHQESSRNSTMSRLWQRVVPAATTNSSDDPNVSSERQVEEEMIALRCERAAAIVSKIGIGRDSAATVLQLDEHWDGSGYPHHSKGEEIPLLSRICAIAQHLDVFATRFGRDQAIQILKDRSGTWFDPALVRITVYLHKANTLWTSCDPAGSVSETRAAVLDFDPGRGQHLETTRVDQICEAFADVVDAKSPFTYRHSVGVADTAYSIAETMGLEPDRVQLVRRAGLLHDIGKLRVPTAILDKKTSLTATERAIVEEHPTLSRRILERIASFHELAVIASQHHERLDGSGYPNHLHGRHLSLESRIVSVADVFGALHEDRPYRTALSIDEIFSILRSHTSQLDADCVLALSACFEL